MKKFEQFITESLEDRHRIKKILTDQDSVGDHMENELGFRPNTDKEHAGTKAYMDMPKWKEDYTCYFFILRANEQHPDKPTPKEPWRIDAWVKVDYNEPAAVAANHTGMKMRATANTNSYLYAVWLPNEIAEQIDTDDNPDDYMWLLKKYKFKV